MKRRTFLAVTAAGVAAWLATPAGHAAVSSTRADIAGGTKDCAQLEALWEAAGGSPGAAFTAAEVAMAESGGSQYATDKDGNGTVDRGYWQINSSHGSLSTYDVYGNARAAVLISSDGTNWTPWVTYDRGLENGQC
jgi:Lysozyme like domain